MALGCCYLYFPVFLPFCLCLYHPFCCCPSLLVCSLSSSYKHIGLGVIFVSLQCFLSYLANHSTLQVSHWLNFFPSIFCKSSVTGYHFIPTVLHLHQQVSNVTIARRQGRTIENHGGDTVCICVMGESEETEVREIWVSGYSDGTESLFEDSRDWYPRCFCSQPPWAQQKPKK